jgi:dihydroorotate dehydrogenase
VSVYKRLIRPILFKTDPEVIHYRVFSWLKMLFSIPGSQWLSRKLFAESDPRLRQKVFGIEFPNPVGLAAGLDKDAKMFSELSALGFGFIEVGTVTPLPQPGNEKPRMFRLPDDHALINRMGFNNEGVEAMAHRLKNRDPRIIVGVNIGKNKITPNDNAATDYETCFRKLFNYADYFAVNVSSPNTAGLRSLQDKGPLLEILNRLQLINDELSSGKVRKPLLLKIAPDLSDEQLDEIIEVALSTKLSGIIATNTTIARTDLRTDADKIAEIGAGGLSGLPLADASTRVIRYLAGRSNKRFSIIGVGGIHSAKDALEKLEAGADLLQLYTGFIYEGPELIREINQAILKYKPRN